MNALLHELIVRSAERAPDDTALVFKQDTYSYAALTELVSRAAAGLLGLGLRRSERVGVYLPKCPEGVAGFFATSMAGGVFVPINPLLKPVQVAHILRDCSVRVLLTSAERATGLGDVLDQCPDLRSLVLIDGGAPGASAPGRRALSWDELLRGDHGSDPRPVIDMDMASILYTSGSTGRPKGVVLSHRNMVAGAQSVAGYLRNDAQDRILAVLPFGFDYGFSQLTTAFLSGATVVLMDYLLPRDVVRAVERHQITGLAGVPPLWNQIASLPWPQTAAAGLRYITNSGGAMPRPTLDTLRRTLPTTDVYLMYGLTEAFRSTYLPPSQLDRRPDSIGKAIPNAEIMVVREDGSPCAPDEPGELVHRGSLVALGYWNDAEKTAERFRAVPGRESGLVLEEIAVWSGDTVRCDEEGYLYFIGRRDDMIKTSGYRVSPTELEEGVYATGLVGEACAVGVAHAQLGQAVYIAATHATPQTPCTTEQFLEACRRHLPAYMIPAHVQWRDSLPRTANGKLDRKLIATELRETGTPN